MSAARMRALYRSLLRELRPGRPRRSPLQAWLRESIVNNTDGGGGSSSSRDAPLQLRTAEQASLYLRAQRTYLALLERYNPAADMGEDERVRRTARRVGMELPKEEEQEDGKKEGI